MILIKFCVGEVILAEEAAKALGELPKSFTKGKGSWAGQLGEIGACSYLGANYLENSTFDYDLIFNGLRVEVKTKRCTSTPSPNYLAAVADVTRRQDCDLYLFTRVWQERDVGWLLGWLPRNEFFKRATFYPKGLIDPEDRRHTIKASCYQVHIHELREVEALKRPSQPSLI